MRQFSLRDLSLALCQLHSRPQGGVGGWAGLTGPLGSGCGVPVGWGPSSGSDSSAVPSTELPSYRGLLPWAPRVWGVDGGLSQPVGVSGQDPSSSSLNS